MLQPNKDNKSLPNSLKINSSVRTRFNQVSQMNKQMNNNNNKKYDNDEYLADLLNVIKIRSKIVGVGGAGNNTISRLQETDLDGAKTLNVNTDAQDLYYSNSDNKILIGKETCNGLGSGNNPYIGAEAAKEDIKRLNSSLKSDIVFITCGLGGGTGTGAAPIVAREAKRNGSLVVSFCTIPFNSEGYERRSRANLGLKKLAEFSDTMITFPNNNLVKIIPKVPLIIGFKIMDEIIIRSIREVVNLVNSCGLINIDFADVKNIFDKKGKYPSGLIGITESLGEKSDIINKSKLAIHNPLLELDANKIEKCLVSISGNHHLTLSLMDSIVSTISNEIPSSAQLKVGNAIDPELGSKIRIMALGSGPISPYVSAAIDDNEDLFMKLMS
ncbi:MAG: cell division protein FtsZ [Candidatus Lokiarchaeota archaeon]|nr:cell division protein FtsZ [Candidatus Lokiarchaeota archaeon]